MELVITIITAVVTLAGMGFKIWKQRQAQKSLEVKLVEEQDRANRTLIALTREREATKERVRYAKLLENSLSEHLKSCNTPLAGWANSLLKAGRKKSGDS